MAFQLYIVWPCANLSDSVYPELGIDVEVCCSDEPGSPAGSDGAAPVTGDPAAAQWTPGHSQYL